MAHVYNSQLDPLELYHRIHENRGDGPSSLLSPGGKALPALGHAITGCVGAAITNICTYPLDLVITRLQTRRPFREVSSEACQEEYKNFQDAVRRIYKTEGGVSGFYTGLLQDTGKTIADSFLFFLAYDFLYQRRMAARRADGSRAAVVLPIFDELTISFISGSLTKLVTTPISNIVTQKQTSALTGTYSADASSLQSREGGSASSRSPSTAQIVSDILKQKGMAGFWSGYSVSLVLSLNPSLTFFLFETFKRLLLPRSQRENPTASATFLMAAIAKACASSLTYPFSVAKTRAQVSSKFVSSDADASIPSVAEKMSPSSARTSKQAANTTPFSSILSIVQSDGPGALYSGLLLELIKSFLSHGTTMILEQYVHGFIIQAYYALGLVVARLQSKGLKAGAQTEKLFERAREQRVEYYDLARARAVETVREVKAKTKAKAEGLIGAMNSLGGSLVGKANETADLVGDYLEEEADEWRNLDGTGLARWFDEK